MRNRATELAPWLACTLAACATTSQTIPPFEKACAVCNSHPESTEAFQPDSVLGPRFLSLRGNLDTNVTWTAGEPHIRIGPTVEVAPFFDRSGVARWRFTTGAAYGAWGDQEHGRVTWQSATGPRFRLAGDGTLFDAYLTVTEGLLAGWGNLAPGRSSEVGNIAGAGFGVDVFRAFSLELSMHWVYAFDSPFVPDRGGSSTRSIPDLGISVSFDTCALGSFCNRTPKSQKSEDGTCLVYTAAKAVCSAAAQTQGGRQQLCEQAASAMRIQEEPPPPLARVSFETFLGNLQAAEASTTLKTQVKTLVDTDSCLLDWRSCGRQRECLLAQQGQEAETHRVYSPYAIEALHALGCNADGTLVGNCDYACDPDPTRQPAVCGGH